MKARLTDVAGPLKRRRVFTFVVGAYALVTLIVSALFTGLYLPLLFGAIFLALAPLFPRRSRPRTVDLTVHAGYIDIENAGLLSDRLRATEIVAASTTRTEGGVALALARRTRQLEPPLVLEVKTEREVTAIREALGLGYHGHGALVWPVSIPPMQGFFSTIRALCLVAFVTLAGHRPGWDVWTGLLYPMVILAILAFVKPGAVPSLWLRQDGVHFFDGKSWRFIAYEDITSVHVGTRELVMLGADPRKSRLVVPLRVWSYGPFGITRLAAEHIAQQVEGSRHRAHGHGNLGPQVSASVELFARAEGEPHSDWLARLDATASALVAGSGYRGGAPAEEELWDALANADADPEIRLAAARILSRACNGATDRIDTIVATVREEKAQRRIRVALDYDIEEASRELDELETTDLLEAVGLPARVGGEED